MPIIFLISLVALIVFIFRKKNKNQPTPVKFTPPPPEPDDAIQIYHYEEHIRNWCCPNCECENTLSRQTCCVCNQPKG